MEAEKRNAVKAYEDIKRQRILEEKKVQSIEESERLKKLKEDEEIRIKKLQVEQNIREGLRQRLSQIKIEMQEILDEQKLINSDQMLEANT